MSADEIIKAVLPYTDKELKCAYRRQQVDQRRRKLKSFLALYLANRSLDFGYLHLSEKQAAILKIKLESYV